MDQASEDEKYYLTKIPQVTSLHPKVKEYYKEKVPYWWQRRALEIGILPDSHKVAVTKFFSPEKGEQLEQAVQYAKKVDKAADTTKKYTLNYVSPYVKRMDDKEAIEQYNVHKYLGNMGGSKRRSRKQINRKKSKNIRKNKKRTRKQKY